MRRVYLAVAVITYLLLRTGVIVTPAYACDGGPDYCSDDPRISAKLAAKKNALLAEDPPRLAALLDRGGPMRRAHRAESGRLLTRRGKKWRN
jgi:hypothetical protein